jgi:hypothetical protein
MKYGSLNYPYPYLCYRLQGVVPITEIVAYITISDYNDSRLEAIFINLLTPCASAPDRSPLRGTFSDGSLWAECRRLPSENVLQAHNNIHIRFVGIKDHPAKVLAV